MNPDNYKLTIISVEKEQVYFTIENTKGESTIKYTRKDESFSFDRSHPFFKVLTENQLQLKKIIRSAIKTGLFPGQKILFAFIQDFPFIKNTDFEHYILVDRRKPQLKIQIKEKESRRIQKIYTDGSYAQDLEQSAFAGIIEDETGNQRVFHELSSIKNSNIMELLAVISGLKHLQHIEKIQVNTDSRFVIRGLAQWIHFWKLNDWHTAQGCKVKFVEYWQQIDELSEGKLLELKWHKTNSGEINHNLCHMIAKQMATQKDESIKYSSL
ncbi:MAG: reverse transcriptase-like protein [Bacteroidales bacterium]|nr:reverse transcriptase-like protein [Bacteroidales bacterium]